VLLKLFELLQFGHNLISFQIRLTSCSISLISHFIIYSLYFKSLLAALITRSNVAVNAELGPFYQKKKASLLVKARSNSTWTKPNNPISCLATQDLYKQQAAASWSCFLIYIASALCPSSSASRRRRRRNAMKPSPPWLQ
jgi:hypothetical protein